MCWIFYAFFVGVIPLNHLYQLNKDDEDKATLKLLVIKLSDLTLQMYVLQMPAVRICVSFGGGYLDTLQQENTTFTYKFLVVLQILAQHQDLFLKTNFSFRLVITSLFLGTEIYSHCYR